MSIKVSTDGITVDGATLLQIRTGNEGYGKVLVSDSSGLVDWTSVRGLVSTERYIGEIYGGGIVVGLWDDGADKKVMIATLQDVGSTDPMDLGTPGYVVPLSVRWSKQTGTFKGATSLYDGRRNHELARVGIDFSFLGNPGSVAINFDGYTGGINGYSDWYLPSLYEMKTMFANANVINRVLGEGNFKVGPRYTNARYWTSSEVDAGNAWSLDSSMTGPIFTSVAKTSTLRMRPIRIEGRSAGGGLVTNLDANDKTSYNDSKLGDRWVDLVNYGMTSSYSFTPSRTFPTVPVGGFTYSAEQGGYVVFDGYTYFNISSPIGSSKIITVEIWAKLKTNMSNKWLFSFGNYGVYLFNSGFGFNTGNTDMFGLSSTQVSNLGLLNNWKHYVFQMQTTSSYTNNKMWINGVDVTPSMSILFGSEASINRVFGTPVRIAAGFQLTTLGGGLGSSMTGNFDCSVFKVYTRALTQAEINAGFNRYRKKYEIGIPTTHTFDVIQGQGTFSIGQNLQLNLPGKKNLKVLRSTVNGTASWVEKNYLFYRPDNERFVGDLYGGGVIVNSWRYPANVFNYVIMSTVDISTSAAWSNVTGNSIFADYFSLNAYTQDFNGPNNTSRVISQVGHSTSAAKLCNDYTGGFGGWYLPAVQEISDAYQNLSAVGYVTATSSFVGRYWTSTEFNGGQAYAFDAGSSTQSFYWTTAAKSSTNKVRAFRRAKVLANYKVWNEAVPEAEPTGDWYVDPWDQKNWATYPGTRTSNLLFEFDPGFNDSYSGRINGFVSTGKDVVSNLVADVRSALTYDAESATLKFPGTYSITTFITTCHIAFNAPINPAPNATLEAWIKPDLELETTFPGNIITRGILSTAGQESFGSNTYYGYTMVMGTNSGSDTYRLIASAGDGLGGGGGNRVSYRSNDFVIRRSVWSHVVVVFNDNNVSAMYVNGVSVGFSYESGTGGSTAASGVGSKVMIGNGFGGRSYTFKGLIGPCRIYNAQILAADVKNNFEYERFKFSV